MEKKVIIIGAGMAGLSSGTYLQMNGYDVHIFESHNVPGGLCTSWKKGDYTVDLCIHWLIGTGKNDSFYDRWMELINMNDFKIINQDLYACVANEDGDVINLYTDVNRLEEELLMKAPEDNEMILELTGAIRKLTSLQMDTSLSLELANLWEKMKYIYKILPYMGVFGKYMKMSNAEFSLKFKNPLLRKAVYNFFEPDMVVVFTMMTFAWMNNKAAGYPIGGSMRFALKVANRFRELGGTLHLNSRVSKIITKNDKAIGVQLSNGEIHRSDVVISAADGHSTIFEMLDHKYLTPKIRDQFENLTTFPSLFYLSLGVDTTLDEYPHSYLFPTESEIEIDPGTTLKNLLVRVHNFDPTLAPKGKTLISSMIETNNSEYWMDLYNADPVTYEYVKNELCDKIINEIEKKIPEIKGNIEMVDAATPATFIRYTNNWKGSFEGWLATPDIGLKHLKQTLNGLENFYMCGHWVAVGGGLPGVLISGRNAAQLICNNDEKPFSIVYPETAEKEKEPI